MNIIEKIKSLFSSRRFYAMVVGVVTVIAKDGLGLSAEQAQWIATIIAGWIVGDSINKTGSCDPARMKKAA